MSKFCLRSVYPGGVSETTEQVRIGELGRRVGLSEHVLRAWERRYGLLRPARSPGGFRLYTAADEARVRRMQAGLDRGLSAAEAARAAIAAHPHTLPSDRAEVEPLGLEEGRSRLRAALDDFDEARTHAALDGLVAGNAPEAVLHDVVLPYLHELGRRWERGEVDVTQEHFASNLLRSRIASWREESSAPSRQSGATGPLAVLACPPGELHDLPLLIFAVALGRAGWQTVFLGADTPLPDLSDTVEQLRPDLVVLAATTPDRFVAVSAEVGALASSTTVAVAGAGASHEVAHRFGATFLPDDPVTAAARIAADPAVSTRRPLVPTATEHRG